MLLGRSLAGRLGSIVSGTLVTPALAYPEVALKGRALNQLAPSLPNLIVTGMSTLSILSTQPYDRIRVDCRTQA